MTLFASCTTRDPAVEADAEAADTAAEAVEEPAPAPGNPRDVVLVNITPEGCCMTVNEAGAPAVGAAVRIRLHTGDALLGTIRWVRRGQAGVMFDYAIDRAKVDYLRREHSTFLSEVPLDEKQALRSVS